QHPSLVPQPVTRPAKRPAARRRMVAAVVLLCLVAGAIVLIAAKTRFFIPEDTPVAKGDLTAKPDPHAFVVVGGQGVAERKFDTLAEAVQGASAGDTIEVRGNGPFVTEPIKINSALTIRAGEGFRPRIQLSELAYQKGFHLLQTNAALVLEGLHLQSGGKAP